jgi:(p)ppGpp synthase/HD superfamily hydrolase
MLPQIRKYIEQRTNKRDMMRSMTQFWPRQSAEYQLIEKAYDDGFAGHRAQWRDSGERYFRHVLAVVAIVLFQMERGRIQPNAHLVIAGFLHDLLEDTPERWTYTAIRKKYGQEVADLVNAVTKPSYKKYGGKNKRHAKATVKKVVQAGPAAICLRLSDRTHNMLTLWGTPHKKRAKIKETVLYYLPLAAKHNLLMFELLQATALQTKSVHINNDQASEVGYD